MNYMEKIAFQNAVDNELKDRYIDQLQKRAYYAEMEKDAINKKLMALVALLGGGLGTATATGAFDGLMSPDIAGPASANKAQKQFWGAYGGDRDTNPDADTLYEALRGLQEGRDPERGMNQRIIDSIFGT